MEKMNVRGETKNITLFSLLGEKTKLKEENT